jgi:hypothetical protein
MYDRLYVVFLGKLLEILEKSTLVLELLLGRAIKEAPYSFQYMSVF